MMFTNRERREVVEKLRSLTTGKRNVIKTLVYECLGLHESSLGSCFLTSESVDSLADLIEPQQITGETSDGYHTFDELYDHRAKLFSVIVSTFQDRAWKSKAHNDGTMFDGMFIVGVETPEGQATYHYDIDPYWDMFECEELEKAPKWDGHTSDEAISRVLSLKEVEISDRK